MGTGNKLNAADSSERNDCCQSTSPAQRLPMLQVTVDSERCLYMAPMYTEQQRPYYPRVPRFMLLYWMRFFNAWKANGHRADSLRARRSSWTGDRCAHLGSALSFITTPITLLLIATRDDFKLGTFQNLIASLPKAAYAPNTKLSPTPNRLHGMLRAWVPWRLQVNS